MRFGRKCKISICLILSIMLFSAAVPVYADAELTNDSIKQKESAISDAKKQVDSLKSGLTDITAVKKQLEASRDDLNAYITKLDSSLEAMQDKIDKYNELIDEKKKDIEKNENELKKAEATQQKQYDEMKKRIRFMYEKGNTTYIDVLASSASFGDILNKADYIEKLSAYDRNKLDEYARQTKYVEACREELKEEKKVLDEAKKDAEKEQGNMNDLLDEKQAQVGDVSANITNKEAAIKEYEAAIASENAEISALEKAVEEEKAKLAQANARQYNGGMFAWPCPSYTRISDNYGERIHPILGIKQFHNGVDMAAPAGSPILAAYDGDVVGAGYSPTMGNYIMIDHGSELYTIYMHASALYVSTGQSVTKGQKIAAVGSTGRSTGSHLHFSVRFNGAYTSPWNYLK
jgi:murein DD-endopeptidase MepM/ murein hydrolase activator NlpD